MKLPRVKLPPLLRDATDPVTGDHLSASERVSWMIQHVIRRWAFLGVLEFITAVCWVVGASHPAVLNWWNLGASDFAIIMEFLIGLAMLGQTLRDALVTRTVLRMEREHGELLRQLVEGRMGMEGRTDDGTQPGTN